MNRYIIASLCIAFCPSAWPKPAADLNGVLTRIDKAGAAFRSMSAKVRRVSHTAVVNDDTIDSGTVLLKRVRAKDLRMLLDLTDPTPKTVAFQGHEVEIYYPKMQTVDILDLGKSKELLEQFLLLGFGTSRTELQASYVVSLAGEDTVNGRKAERLELVPQSKEVLQHLLKLEMWVGDDGYPIQQKFYFKAGDYELATYSDMKINPEVTEAELKLKLPKNVKRNYPQKVN